MTNTIPNNVYDLPVESVPSNSRMPAVPKSQAAAALEKVATDLNGAPQAPGEEPNMEAALLRFNQTMRDNTILRTRIAELEGTLRAAQTDADTSRGIIRDIREQRDLFANYAIEVKTRMETLLVLLDGNAAETEKMVGNVMSSIEQYVDGQMAQLSTAFAGNAATATKLITEALEAAKNDAINRVKEAKDDQAKS